MNKTQIPLDCGMPGYRAHLAGTAALVVEFGARAGIANATEAGG